MEHIGIPASEDTSEMGRSSLEFAYARRHKTYP
jgi:hypothetical protein